MTPFQRIVVTGNSGAGKTSLSLILAKHTAIDLYHLDTIIYKDNWKKRSRAEIEHSIGKIVKKRSWIIDGVSKQAFEAADTIVFLDYSPITTFTRAFLRAFKGRRPESPEHSNELSALWLVLKLTFMFPQKTKPIILDYKHKQKVRFVHIKNDKDLDAFISKQISKSSSAVTS